MCAKKNLASIHQMHFYTSDQVVSFVLWHTRKLTSFSRHFNFIIAHAQAFGVYTKGFLRPVFDADITEQLVEIN